MENTGRRARLHPSVERQTPIPGLGPERALILPASGDENKGRSRKEQTPAGRRNESPCDTDSAPSPYPLPLLWGRG